MEDKYMELYTKFSKISWMLHKHHISNYAKHGPMYDPARGQGRVIAMLKMKEEISTKELSYLLGIRKQSLNELLNKLEKSGYVTRTPLEEDKRIMLVKLTEKGKDEKQENKNFGDIFGCLNDEEREKFGEYLEKIILSLKEQLGDDIDMFENNGFMDKDMRNEKLRAFKDMNRGRHHHNGGFHHPWDDK